MFAQVPQGRVIVEVSTEKIAFLNIAFYQHHLLENTRHLWYACSQLL